MKLKKSSKWISQTWNLCLFFRSISYATSYAFCVTRVGSIEQTNILNTIIRRMENVRHDRFRCGGWEKWEHECAWAIVWRRLINFIGLVWMADIKMGHKRSTKTCLEGSLRLFFEYTIYVLSKLWVYKILHTEITLRRVCLDLISDVLGLTCSVRASRHTPLSSILFALFLSFI